MRRTESCRTFLLAALASASLVIAAGCAGTTDDGDATTEPDREPGLIASGVHAAPDGDAVGLLFGHTADESWTFEALASDEIRFRRQAQGRGNGGGNGGNDAGVGNGLALPPTPVLNSQFVVGSSALARFGNSARSGSGASVRFAAASGGRARFAPSGSDATRFDPIASDGAGRCDPAYVCDYIQAVCRNAPEYASNSSLSCGEGVHERCRNSFALTDLGGTSRRAVCTFSAVFRCATRGIRTYGRISSEAELRRAIQSGVQTCRVGAVTEVGVDLISGEDEASIGE
jgi:hypothetical protein